MKHIEMQRSNVTPRAFFTACKKAAERKGMCVDDWVSFEDWSAPITPCESKSNHEDWEEPQREIYRVKPFDWQLYLEKTYNFIMEFQFDDEKSGYGYFYLVENNA